MMKSFVLYLALGFTTASNLCLPDCSSGVCLFDFNVRLTAGQLGYFTVKGCDGVSPTLGMEVGVTHKFLQYQYKNYFHPLGFAYYADGAHDDVEELEPGIAPPGSNSTCASNYTCPAPMYFVNGEYSGHYSNDPNVLEVSSYRDNTGLDDYEPKFFYPFSQWLEQGEFSVNLRFDQHYEHDIFYFCHVSVPDLTYRFNSLAHSFKIHQFMSGRIKLLKRGVPMQQKNFPEIPYKYDQPSEYDRRCGSFGLEEFRLPNPECPKEFVCGKPVRSTTFGRVADCTETQNCYMFAKMTTGFSAKSEKALFMHQMIPHHENAINMAKTLLVSGELNSCDVFVPGDPICEMWDIAISIVNGQNFQIQQMRKLLDSYGYPTEDDCAVTLH